MSTRHARYVTLALLTTLAACGGGGDSSTNSAVNVSSKSTAQSVSASGAVMPNDSTEAAGVAVTTARAAIASVTGSCPGGGTATFSVSGGTLVSRANGVFDAGEAYDITFAQCRSATNAAAVTGRMTLSVVSTAPSLVVNTGTVNLSVALPLRTITLNGSSTLTQTIANSGANTTTTTNHWTSTGIRVDSLRNSGGSTHYELSDVDYTRSIVTVNGALMSSSCDGHSRLDARLLFFPWFITLATIGPIQYGFDGVVVSGRWLIDLPDDRIELRIAPGSVSLLVDLGANGSVDLSFFFSLDTFFDVAG